MTVPDLADVLAEVNRLRAERDLEPLSEMPKGLKGDPKGCPLKVALDVYSAVPSPHGCGYYRVDGDSDAQTPLPRILSVFGKSFDWGSYPELVER